MKKWLIVHWENSLKVMLINMALFCVILKIKCVLQVMGMNHGIFVM